MVTQQVAFLGTVEHGLARGRYHAFALVAGLVIVANAATAAAFVSSTLFAGAVWDAERFTQTVHANVVRSTQATDLAASIRSTFFGLIIVINAVGLTGARTGKLEETIGVRADSAAPIAPIGNPAATGHAALVDCDGTLFSADHEGRAVTATNVWNFSASCNGNALPRLAFGAGRT